MSLFSYYQASNKSFPCGPDGFLTPNFKSQWIYAIGRSPFPLEREQNLRTWQREWPTLDDDSKKAAMSNVIKFLGRTKNDDFSRGGTPDSKSLKLLEPYLSVFTNTDAIAWTAAFMSSDLAGRSGQEYEIPTLTFAAHLLDWIRKNRPSVLKKCVAMLESWEPFAQSKLYKDDEAFPGALERLSQVMPNTALERTSAVACAISGQDALLSNLLSRPETNTSALLKHAQGMSENFPPLGMFSALDPQGKSDIFLANARELGKQMLSMYKKQTKLGLQPENNSWSKESELLGRCEFLHKLVVFGVDCSDASVSLLKDNGRKLSIARFFHYLGELSQQWSPKQHAEFLKFWDGSGGLYMSEDLFANHENKKSLLNALSKLPVAWTEWFESEYRNELKTSGSRLMDSTSREGISIEAHRWFHEQTPKLYEHWIRGLPANPQLLNDPVVGDAAWTHTQANSENFLFDTTLAWVTAPEVHYDLHHSKYPLAKLAWSRHGIDLDASVQEAMKDTQCDYRSLAVEAISPGVGKNRWQALMCVVDAFKETGDAKSPWSQQHLVQDVIRTSINERLHPSTAKPLIIDNAQALFTATL